MNIVSFADCQAQRWRNNGGWTRELLAWPPGQDWELRISVADIEADGPFSAFAGVERWFAVLHGAGVDLAGQVLTQASELFAFSGDEALSCHLLDGMTRDFNLMHKRGQGTVQVLPAQGVLHSAEHAVWVGCFCRTEQAVRVNGHPLVVPEMSLVWNDGGAQEWQFVQTAPNPRAWWIELRKDSK